MKLKNLFRAINYVWKRAKFWTICSLIFSITNGLAPLASLWVMKELINTVSSIIQGETTSFSQAFYLLILQFLIMFLSSVIEGLKNFMDDRVRLVLEHDLKKQSSEKSMSVPYTYYDIPEFYNHLNRIKGSPGVKFLAPLRNILDTLEAIIRIVSFLAFLLTIHWLLVVMSVFAAIPIFIVQSIYGKKNFWLMFMQTPIAREVNYLEYLMNDKQSAKETRIFDISTYLLNRWSNKFKKNANEKLQLIKKQQFAEIGLDSLTAFMYVGAAGIIIWLMKTTSLKIGEFVVIGQAVQGTQESISQISENIAHLYEDSLYINDYFAFMDFEYQNHSTSDRRSSFPKKIENGIKFQNVSYKYPSSEVNTIDGVTFEINKGEKVAIVGENGSGKTTLANILLNLYTPTSGKVQVDDVDIKTIDQKEWRENVTAILQDFIRYSFQADENIAIGKDPDEIDKDKLLNASKVSKADTFINNFKDGYSTQLGRFLVDGEELSGGQWQKIAIARTMFRKSQIIVLDEPTASLDPLAELEVFNQFYQISKDKTVLYISHRMSAAKFADKIFVMEKGKLIETGPHSELVKLKGKYYEMYNKQKWWYEDDNVVEEVAT